MIKVGKGINWLRELKSPQVGSHTSVQVWLDHAWSKDRVFDSLALLPVGWFHFRLCEFQSCASG